MPTYDAKTIAIALAAISAAGFALSLSWRKSPTPPGPRGWPIIGNALNIPSNQPWKVYLQWGRKYNTDILFIRLPGSSLVVLNSARAVRELLIQKSTNHADRPQSVMLGKLMGMEWMLGLMQYGNEWKLHRKVFRREFDTAGAIRAHELVSARRLLKRLLDSSVNYAREVQLTTGDTILSATYGITPKSEDDYYIRLVESQVMALTEVVRKPYLVDMFPMLRFLPKWFPGASFHAQAEAWKELGYKVRNLPYDFVKQQAAKGTAAPSVALRFLAAYQSQEQLNEENSEDIMRNILAEAYIGGAGATVGTICSFILAMALHPQVQKKAQAALDAALCGRRLPDFSDYGQIPYMDATINEVLRWNPGAPLGVFHAVHEDDYYDGYLIPKGSMITGNTWAILHDEEVYGPDTESFAPERFLTSDGQRNKHVPDPEAAFGFGRRICPGKFIGHEILWITSASLLSVFDISDPVGRDGKPLDHTKIEYTNSMSSRPPYFDVKFRRRSTVQESVIIEAVDEASQYIG